SSGAANPVERWQLLGLDGSAQVARRAWPQCQIENQRKGKQTGDQAENKSHSDKPLKTCNHRKQGSQNSHSERGELPAFRSSDNDGLNVTKIKSFIGFCVTRGIDAQQVIFAEPKARARGGKSDKTRRTPACPCEALIFLLCHR